MEYILFKLSILDFGGMEVTARDISLGTHCTNILGKIQILLPVSRYKTMFAS